MKKWKVVLSLLMILIFISTPGLAAKNSSMVISIDGKKFNVKEVPIVMDGQAVYSDIPTFIHPENDYTLVPIRFIAERYGAEVKWDQKTQTATVIQKNKEIKMTINSNNAYIDGQKKVLDGGVAPKLVTFSNNDARTMVPLRFVSETLGYEVGWDSSKGVPFINTKTINDPGDTDNSTNSREITDISIDKGSNSKPKIVINGTKELKYSTMLLENPDRLVIDIDGAVLNLKENIPFNGGIGNIDVNSRPIERLSVSQFSKSPDTVRIVVHLTEYMDYDIKPENNGKTITLSFVNKTYINKVGKIKKEIIDGKEALVIYKTGETKTNVLNLKNPGRIVVDLMDSSLKDGEYFDYDYNIGFIKGVRVSQFVPDNLYKPDDRIVRVVLDLLDGVSDPSVKIDTYDDRVVITPEKSIWEALGYSLEGTTRIVSINANRETDYEIEYNRESNTMNIYIPSEDIDLEAGYAEIMDGLINDITVKKDRYITTFTINFRRGIKYDVVSNAYDRDIVLMIERDQNVKPSDRLIVIDPGHGGKAPGAVQNGYEEKDINLAISLKLNERLMDKGYNTIMTRDKDTDVDLHERARIANSYQADLFISIHANSNQNSSITGIQVLYCPRGQSKVKTDDNYPLSEILMDEITKGVGAQNKGIIQKPGIVVLKETSMPAALIEVGFLTNPEEAKLLNDSEYQSLLVESIIKGIEKYFDLY